MNLQDFLEQYRRDHTHPVNKATHMIGIPMILVSIPFLFLMPPVGIFLFVLGWIFQFIGHAFEGKAPSFFRDPRFLFVGATWYVTKLRDVVLGKKVEVRDAPPAAATASA